MKKILLIICMLTFPLLSSCKNIPAQTQKIDIENVVASQLMQIDNNYSDETLKALSVILRTNTTLNNLNTTIICNDEKYNKIALSTKGQVLKNSKGNYVELGFETYDDYTWQKAIRKSDILEFARKHNISLTNLSKINPITKNDKILGLEIGNKYFDYNVLAEEFNLESNIIDKISQTKNEIIIHGKNKGFYGYFDIEKSEQLSNNNYFYKDILKNFFDNLFLIKN